MNLFNEGDTACLILNYEMNGSPLVEGAYDEIEFQINPQTNFSNVKKLLSKGEIVWGSASYVDGEGHTQTFTGYITYLTQADTFKIKDGTADVQLRVLIGDEVGSSEISTINIGNTLSTEVLE